MTRTRRDVEDFIAQRGLTARVRDMPHDTHTAADSARALGTDTSHIAKSLLARLSDGRFILCIVCGDKRLDRRKLCRAAGAKRMSLATADEVLAITGYVVGAVPPLALETALAALIDETVLEKDRVYCGGGDVDTLLEISTQELLAITAATPADLAEDAKAE
jgi:Cys-tRNA(Pro) deacylase